MTTSSVHHQTPTIAVIDNRGLTIREVQYYRHPDAPAVTVPRTTRHRYDVRGTLTQSADLRLGASGQANVHISSTLGGEPLLTVGTDNGALFSFNDAEGRPHLHVTAEGVVRRWIYEDASLPGRPLSIVEQAAGAAIAVAERFEYADSTPQAQAYNLAGQCIRHDDTAGRVTTASISLGGTPLSVTRTLPDGESHTMLTTADAAGATLTATDAAGHLQRVAYDVAGLLKGSWLTLNGQREQVIVKSLTHSAAGQKLREEHGNGVVTTYQYEPETQRLSSIKTERPAGHAANEKVLQDLRYDYDPVGNVLKVHNDAEETRFWRNQKVVPENTYVYDSLYQLVSATGREMANIGQQGHHLPEVTSFDNASYVNYTRRYDYDSAGNLTQIRHSALNNNHTTRMTVSDRSNRAVLSTLTEKPSEVDALFTPGGQQKALLPGQSLSWTPRGELAGVGDSESYIYDSQSQRVLKVGHGVQTARVVYLPGLELRSTAKEKLQVICIAEAGRAQVRALHWEDGKPADIANNQLRWSYDNLTGSRGLEVDGEGKVISREEYYPFGGTAILTARNQTEAGYKTIRYSGKERDATGLYYYGYRYYQPWAGRWLSADPADTIDGLNLYRMCRNNPGSGMDSDGRMFKRIANIRDSESTASSIDIPDYPLPASERVSEINTTLSPGEITQHKKAISEGEYPKNSIRHNFLYGKDSLPEPTNIPLDLYKGGYTSETVTRNFLHAANQLTSYAGGKVIYRGTLVPYNNHTSLQPGNMLQSHQFSFFSESDLVSRAFIDSSENGELYPVIFKIKDIPGGIFKEGLLSSVAYDDLKNSLSKKGINPKKMAGIGSTHKEIIALPGAVFKVIKTKQIRSDIHKNRITKVNLKFVGMSKGVHHQALL